jgi:dienelactone hydrolase
VLQPNVETRAPAAVRTAGHWFGPAGRPLMGWLTTPASGPGSSGVLVLPPVGYQYWSTHRTMRTVAERLAAAGHTVLRIDYDGTGDSAGDQWDAQRVPAWRASARAAADELRSLGTTRLAVVGARLGGMFALLDGDELGAERVVAWAPVTAGRRYAKENRLLSTPVPDSDDVVSAGVVFAPETLADIASLKADNGGAVVVDGGEQALEQPTEYATVPEDVVAEICDAVGPSGDGSVQALVPRETAQFGAIAEEVVALGPGELVGVLSRPRAGSDLSAPVAVFLNTGSEPHVGPGRAWVEYARRLAEEGYTALRVDFSGWGESPDHGHAPGRPYDAHCEDETIEIVRALRERGHEKVVLVGLCAGAWVALRAVLREPADGVVALNPQLYWQPGDPVEALMSETRERRTPDRLREERGCRLGLWSALDVLGRRPWAGTWLDELRASGVPVAMVFAEGDDGIEYLRNRLGRRLIRTLRGGAITVEEVPGIDHSMHRAWLRDSIAGAIRRHLDRVR